MDTKSTRLWRVLAAFIVTLSVFQSSCYSQQTDATDEFFGRWSSKVDTFLDKQPAFEGFTNATRNLFQEILSIEEDDSTRLLNTILRDRHFLNIFLSLTDVEFRILESVKWTEIFKGTQILDEVVYKLPEILSSSLSRIRDLDGLIVRDLLAIFNLTAPAWVPYLPEPFEQILFGEINRGYNILGAESQRNGTGSDRPNALSAVLTLFRSFDYTRLSVHLLTSLNFVGPEDMSEECFKDLEHTVKSLLLGRNWAIKVVDALGKPQHGAMEGTHHFLGCYDECLKIEADRYEDDRLANSPITKEKVFGAQYCTFEMPMPSIPGLKFEIPPGTHLFYDFCVPNSCKSEDFSGLNQIQLFPEILKFNESRILCSDETLRLREKVVEDPFALTVSVVILLLIGAILIATAVDELHFKKKRNYELENNWGEHIEDEPKKSSDGRERIGIFQRIIESCSLLTAVPALMSTKTAGDYVRGIDCIRVFSLGWIMLGHVVLYIIVKSKETVANPFNGYVIIGGYGFQEIFAGSMAVDTFFLLSGLLVTHLHLKQWHMDGFTLKGQLLYLVHRYIRLTPVYLVVILSTGAMSQYMGDGPMSSRQPVDHGLGQICRSYWWTNILYINNLFGPQAHCMEWSWYVAADMQLYIIAPIFIIPLHFRRPIIAGLILVAGFLTHVSTNAYYFSQSDETFVTEDGLLNELQYIKPWCRIGPYLIGIVLGYVLHRKWRLKSAFKAVVAWVVAVCAFYFVAHIPFTEMKVKGDEGVPYSPWPHALRATYEAVRRILFSLSVAWIVYALNNGWSGPLRHVFNWRGWTPLSRLVYGAYLIHPLIMIYYNLYLRQLTYLNFVNMFLLFLPFAALSLATSGITYLFVESPSSNLNKKLLRYRKEDAGK